jgi:chromosomal replication initiator protein
LNVANIWQEFLQIVTVEVGSRVVETWFKAVSFSRWDSASKTVYLKAPNTFVKEWVSSQYQDLLKVHLSRLLNETGIRLLFLDESKTEIVPVESKKVHSKSTQNAPAKYIVNQRYQFDSFIVGPNNELACAAAQAVAAQPGVLYNPLFIYGGAGMGKTHLLHSVGNEIKQKQPQSRILYQSADRFVHEFINAIRFDKIAHFEARYKDVDVLLVDDIQLISHKEQTQEAFFHIFNSLYDNGKQIVFSADTPPDKIEGLTERLKSRLTGSLITDIHPPTLDTRIAILHKKADLQREALSPEVAHFIASRTTTNIRELEGLLIRVLAFATLTHQVVSLALAHKVLERTPLEYRRQAALDMPRIADKVARHFNFSVTQLRSNKRQKNLVLARHVAMYLMKKHTDHSLLDIAAYWCRKDHSTVIHAISKLEHSMQEDRQLQIEIERLDTDLQRI